MIELRECSICCQDKDTSEFAITGDKGKGYRVSFCNECRSSMRRETARKVKAEAILYKGGKCNDCNLIVHQAAFEFHHIDPSTKAFKTNTSKVRKEPTHYLQGVKELTDQAKTELDKCVLLCANCHRVRHFSDLL
jgi:hypothetical protein